MPIGRRPALVMELDFSLTEAGAEKPANRGLLGAHSWTRAKNIWPDPSYLEGLPDIPIEELNLLTILAVASAAMQHTRMPIRRIPIFQAVEMPRVDPIVREGSSSIEGLLSQHVPDQGVDGPLSLLLGWDLIVN
ncbi:hypothetical protein [Geothrix sp. 21YS21S-2]|uniref:hypothetical protein n=1 Tax=Geothrix sp. 21YS21S-2 TaxID=3068893 RepID=UPI0027BA71BA|nr:hypothetical protein [Geothrix sp. 21YS21S-2]